MMSVKNIYIVGIGLIGGSIAKDVKRLNPNLNILGIDSNPEHLEECIKTYGADYDLIVDDGSHYGEHIVTSFKTLYPYLKNYIGLM